MSAEAVAVVGVAGGCGASTLAGALALHRARSGAAAWLLELDLDRADLADAWDVPGDRTLADLAPVAGELDAGHLDRAAQVHDGVRVLLAPPGPAADAWAAAALDGLVAAARAAAGSGGRVVADLGCGLSARAAAVAGAADRVLLACPGTIAGARRARRMAEALGEVRCALAVAGPGDRELSARALGRAAGVPVAAELPWVPREATRLAAGRWPAGRRPKLAAAIGSLAEALA